MTWFAKAFNTILDTCLLLIYSPKYCFVVGIWYLNLLFLSVSKDVSSVYVR